MVASENGDELRRLRQVQSKFRGLVLRYPWLADRVRSSFGDYVDLVKRYVAERSVKHEQERSLARRVLLNGQLRDRRARGKRAQLVVQINGICSKRTAERLAKRRRTAALPKGLEKAGAGAALQALDYSSTLVALSNAERARKSNNIRAALRTGKFVKFTWRVVVAQPATWDEPVHPGSLDLDDLSRLTDNEYLIVSLYHLGGLVDAGATRPVVPRPPRTDDCVRDAAALTAWHERLPIARRDRESACPPLCPAAFPPEIAEQMLAHVEAWARTSFTRRGGSSAAAKDKRPRSGGLTQIELISLTADKDANAGPISVTIFRELVHASGIRRTRSGEKGRRFDAREIRALIETAERLGKQDRVRIAERWAPHAQS